jgi:hypothetical protein
VPEEAAGMAVEMKEEAEVAVVKAEDKVVVAVEAILVVKP